VIGDVRGVSWFVLESWVGESGEKWNKSFFGRGNGMDSVRFVVDICE
jgi:hypothetical protein